MRRNAWKLLAPFVALSVLAAACGGGGGSEVADRFTDIANREAKDVEPPERVDPKDFAQPGLLVQTNSKSMQDLADAPDGRGAVVLFVQPGGPSDRKGIARGDMIVAVEGQRVTNAEFALTALRTAAGETRKITFKTRGGNEREIEIKGEVPTQRAKPFLDGMIKASPSDPVLRYLRALVAGGSDKENLADLKAALRQAPNFVEALSLQGNYVFNARNATKDAKKKVAIIGEALASWATALDIDPKHAETLALQSAGQHALGKFDQARIDAEKAVKIDPSFAAANHALARAELGLKKPQNAAGPARAAVEANPFTNLNYYRTLAQVFRELKRSDDCKATLSAIVPHLEGSKVEALVKEATQLKKEAGSNCS